MFLRQALSPLKLLVLLALAVPSTSWACSCLRQTLEEAIAAAPFVFVGKVVKVEIVGTENGVDSIEATVLAGEVFKGEPGRRVTFITDNGCCYCSYEFEVAKEYLFFASKQGRYFMTNACSRSAIVGAAEEDLKVLRSGAQL